MQPYAFLVSLLIKYTMVFATPVAQMGFIQRMEPVANVKIYVKFALAFKHALNA